MKIALTIIQIIIAISLIGLILIQSSKGGLGSAWGGGGEFRTRRGAEKIIFKSTIVVSILFLIVSIINISIQ
jgi:preprotein translocase subunit SecG